VIVYCFNRNITGTVIFQQKGRKVVFRCSVLLIGSIGVLLTNQLSKILNVIFPLSDNGSCYLSGELKSYLSKRGVEHTRGKPMHPQTQGKIERYHRTMKNRILLEHYYSPEELERALDAFIDFYNNNRLHESLDNLAPADVYFNRGEKILKQREEIKQKTILQRRINHLLQIQNQSLSFV